MNWVSFTKLKTVCEAIKNYVDNADALKVNVSDEMTDVELTETLNIFESGV